MADDFVELGRDLAKVNCMISHTHHRSRNNLFLHYLISLLALITAFLVNGCETSGISNRITEKAAIFNTLPPIQQQDIKNGYIGDGYTTDMVYMAVGQPSKTSTTSNGQDTTWTYNNFYPAYSSQSPQNTFDSAHTAGRSGANDYVSANAPGANKSLSDTSTKGAVQTSATIPDLPSDTLFIVFREGRVIKHWLASDVR